MKKNIKDLTKFSKIFSKNNLKFSNLLLDKSKEFH